MFDVLHALAGGDTAVLPALHAALDEAYSPGEVFLREGLRHAAQGADRETLMAWWREDRWARQVFLEWQEYQVVFPGDPLVELDLRGALAWPGWGHRHRDALRRPGRKAVTAAGALLQDLQALAHEAAGHVRGLAEMRNRLTDDLHILQLQTLTRLERALGDVAGRRVLEIGPEAGGLLRHLRAHGADAVGVELRPRPGVEHVLAGDFMTCALPGPFDAVVATAVLEEGSGWDGLRRADGRTDTPRLLARLRELLVPGGVLVLENVGLPLPFAVPEAAAAGLELVRMSVPGVNLRAGGRGAALRRV